MIAVYPIFQGPSRKLNADRGLKDLETETSLGHCPARMRMLHEYLTVDVYSNYWFGKLFRVPNKLRGWSGRNGPISPRFPSRPSDWPLDRILHDSCDLFRDRMRKNFCVQSLEGRDTRDPGLPGTRHQPFHRRLVASELESLPSLKAPQHSYVLYPDQSCRFSASLRADVTDLHPNSQYKVRCMPESHRGMRHDLAMKRLSATI